VGTPSGSLGTRHDRLAVDAQRQERVVEGRSLEATIRRLSERQVLRGDLAATSAYDTALR